MAMEPALPGQSQPTASQPGTEPQPLKSVTITDNGDGTFTVKSSDEQTESAEQQAQEPSESEMPVKSIDEALAKAKKMLSGEAGGEDLEAIFKAQFPSGASAEKEYGTKY